MPEQKASELISFNEAIIQQKDAYSYIEEGVPKDRNWRMEGFHEPLEEVRILCEFEVPFLESANYHYYLYLPKWLLRLELGLLQAINLVD